MNSDVSTTHLAANGIIVAGSARLKGFLLHNTAGAGTAAIIYDNASAASGTKVITIPTGPAGLFWVDLPENGIRAENGLYLDINGFAAVTAVYA